MRQRRPSLSIRLASLPALAVLLLGSSCSVGDGELDSPDLQLLFTSNIHGYIEPCGCVAGQIGGIDRIAAFIRDQRAAHPATLFVDCGDLLAETISKDAPISEQLPIKARAFYEVWSELECDAMAIGEIELALGARRIQALANRYDLPILCGNLVDEQGQLLFPDRVIVERGGQKIGIFSVLAPRLQEAKTEDPKPVNIEGLASSQGLELLPWRPSATRIASELAETCDLVLFASHAGFNFNRVLAQAVPEIDLIFGGHWGQAERQTYQIGATPVLVSVTRGARVGQVRWWWDDPGEYFRDDEPHGGLLDVSDWVAVRNSYEVERISLERLSGREGILGSAQWQKQREHHQREALRFSKLIENLGPVPEGNRFSHVQVPMHHGLRRSELALSAVDRYHEQVQEFWSGRDGSPVPLSKREYVGSELCRQCHPGQYEFWRSTRHSRALSTLAATNQALDAECIGCHTTGYQLPGGFPMPDRFEDFENVQCEACHGPAKAHVAGGLSYLNRSQFNLAPTGFCVVCHNKEHDPDFEKEGHQRLPLVVCPSFESPGGRSDELVGTYQKMAGILAERDEPPLDEVAALLLMAGDLAGCVETAERWLETQPRSMAAQLFLANRYLEIGRRNDALDLYRAAHRKRPNNAIVLSGLSEALRPTDPQAALRYAQEAFSLRPQLPQLRLEALARIALGQTQGAREIMEQWIAGRPMDEPALADLLSLVRQG